MTECCGVAAPMMAFFWIVRWRLQPGRPRQVDGEPVTASLISADHFRVGVVKVLLNVSLAGLRRRRQGWALPASKLAFHQR